MRPAQDSWLVFHLGPYGLWGLFCAPVCFRTRGEEGLLQPVGSLAETATLTTAVSANRVDLGSLSSRSCTFRHTRTSEDPIRLLCIRLAFPSTLSLPSGFTPSERLIAGRPPRALWLAGIVLRRKEIYAGGVVRTRIDWVLNGEGV